MVHFITYPIDNQLTEERVDLSVFSPACLPDIGESFVDQIGTVYGEQHISLSAEMIFFSAGKFA